MLRTTLTFILLTVIFSAQKPKDDGLKDLFKDSFFIGVAVNVQQVSGKETGALAVIEKHFNSLSPENGLKWEKVIQNWIVLILSLEMIMWTWGKN
ncbi:endo-1,4-beta-xylanase [Algoriphagus ratkowskyi]|uniref:Endo-1,4-beta-xylanase n=1 Tax=Algoriphagus ratkowskyi TaxID=57028 RepID=A0A2W7R6J2_9BACT|nr:endo-1,4-beta-xylanase [Algoriphagus ratkowskyi]PZX56084.1 endo-1,4-beta-xylanase [Algoriphagus ratkowskyi]